MVVGLAPPSMGTDVAGSAGVAEARPTRGAALAPSVRAAPSAGATVVVTTGEGGLASSLPATEALADMAMAPTTTAGATEAAAEVSPPFTAAPTVPGSSATARRNGMWAIAAMGPMASPRRPSEMDRKARTTSGEKWAPAHRVSSARASTADIGFLYERVAVITS